MNTEKTVCIHASNEKKSMATCEPNKVYFNCINDGICNVYILGSHQ